MVKKKDKSKLITGLILLVVGLIIGFDFIVGKIIPVILVAVGIYMLYNYYKENK